MAQNNQIKWEVGDRFIFVKNILCSDAVPLGFKGVVEEVYRDAVFCDGYSFEFEEIKKIITVRG
ncbi:MULTISPECIES: hypothetical protein [unclassified Acinetobacter]|uniref:hypothetical protein n=1 Tax=unclassified Acinetobacter TaxID=196816 RepID=UPI00287F298C|nr:MULTISPECIES: hypothetical protein [unclassified Acinetobacter]MDS7956765.1 hypothetical protein [Acinetobacter sp. V104_13]MDS7984345.1 hypothetical protein [Acinetobacter sp. V104_3]